MADEDSAEDDNDDDHRSEEGNDGNAETSDRISSQQTSVDQGNAPATQPVPTRPVHRRTRDHPKQRRRKSSKQAAWLAFCPTWLIILVLWQRPISK